MNIIDLTYCLFYRHDEKHDIGFPPIGAVAGLAFILGLYFLTIVVLLRTFVLDSLPSIGKKTFFLIYAAYVAVLFLPFRTKEIRNRKLQKYDEYKKAHPRKYLCRFWLFVSLSIVLSVASILIANMHYETD
ncbi:MAG: hypothetical protein K6E96_02170 [Bacteroidales bacterium]|nr:hypothetical protein [Bacteroidales bacterium]